MKSQRGSLSFMICNQLLFRGEKVETVEEVVAKWDSVRKNYFWV